MAVIKKLFGKDSILTILQKIIAILAVVVPVAFTMVGAINNGFEKKLEPINNFIFSQIIREVDNQYYKISNGHDVNPDDLEWVINKYHQLPYGYGDLYHDELMVVIRKHYMEVKI